MHFEASVQCDRGTGAHGVRKGGETALFEPINCFPTHKKSTTHNVARFLKYGDPKRYFVLLGIRSMQAKE